MLHDPPRGAFDYLLDGNTIELPPVVHKPPLEPPRGGPVRVHINIEITHSRRAERRQDRSRAVWVIVGAGVLVLMLLASARAETTRWQENRVGTTTYWNNLTTGVRGQERPMPDGSTRFEWQDPQGRVTHCVVQNFGNTIRQTCD